VKYFNKPNVFLLILLMIGMGIFYPFVHSILFIPAILLKPIVGLSFMILLFYIILKKRIILPVKQFNNIVFILFVYLFLYSLFFSSLSVAYYMFYTFASWLILVIVINTTGLNTFMKFFIRLNVVASFLLFIGVVLLSLGLLHVYSEIEYQGKIINNYLFFFMKQFEGIHDYRIVRAAGYYDEPGSMAYVTMFLLLINHKYYKSKFVENTLLILPLITTSLAHIVTAIVYCLFFKISSKKKFNTFFLVTIVLIAFYTLKGMHTDNTVIDNILVTTIKRVENIIEGGQDMSRLGGYELGPHIFKKYQLGISPERIEEEYPDFIDETFWFPILVFGIFGVFIYFLPITYIMISRFSKLKLLQTNNEIKYVIILLLNFGQRPHYIFPIYIILIYFLFFYDISAPNKNKIYDEKNTVTIRYST
jgi:hypothetical protein